MHGYHQRRVIWSYSIIHGSSYCTSNICHHRTRRKVSSSKHTSTHRTNCTFDKGVDTLVQVMITMTCPTNINSVTVVAAVVVANIFIFMWINVMCILLTAATGDGNKTIVLEWCGSQKHWQQRRCRHKRHGRFNYLFQLVHTINFTCSKHTCSSIRSVCASIFIFNLWHRIIRNNILHVHTALTFVWFVQ